MSKRLLGLIAIVATISFVGITLLVLFPAPDLANQAANPSDSKPLINFEKQITFQGSGGSNGLPDDSFFIFDTTITDLEVDNGDQTHGTQDKVGVNKSIMNAYSNEVGDFVAIGDANTARVQYLATIGRPVTRPDSKWLVTIEEAGVVNGQIRVRVMAFAGVDMNSLGQKWMESDGALLMELWSLDVTGSNPTLLDRTQRGKFNGLQTHQESPITFYTRPPGTTFGPFGSGDPADFELGPWGEYGSGGDGPPP